MTGVIQLFGDAHQKAQMLLPWYVTGTLDPVKDAADLAMLETHLAACPECRAELASERILRAGIAGLPMTPDKGWSELISRIAPQARRRSPLGQLAARASAGLAELGRGWKRTEPWARGALLAQSCALACALAVLVIMVLGATLVQTASATHSGSGQAVGDGAYHVLGRAGSGVDSAANVAVIFRSQTSLAQLKSTLDSAGARIVDGPTAHDVYLLHVAPETLSATVAGLRHQADVKMAEPVDGEAGR